MCRVGHPAKIRAAETRKQKHDRRDARLMLDLLMRKNGFPEIWMPSIEQRDLRTLLRDRHQWVKMRTRVQNTLQAIALNHALRYGRALWSPAGQKALQVGSVSLHQSKAGRTAALVRAVAEADPETRSAGGRRSKAATADVAAANASGSGADHGIGHRGVPGRPEPFRQWQERSQLHRNDPL